MGFPFSALKILEGFHVEAAQRMTDMRPQQRIVRLWVYPMSVEVLAAAQLKPVTTYTRWQGHNSTKTNKGHVLLEKCRGRREKMWQSGPHKVLGAGNGPEGGG